MNLLKSGGAIVANQRAAKKLWIDTRRRVTTSSTQSIACVRNCMHPLAPTSRRSYRWQLAVFTQDAACASFEVDPVSQLLTLVSSHGSREAVAKGACAQAASESIQQERSNLI